MNGALLSGWLKPAGGNLCDRLLRCSDRNALVHELYFSTLTRAPTEAEIESADEFLLSFGNDEKSGIQELVRTILCSAEFRLNH